MNGWYIRLACNIGIKYQNNVEEMVKYVRDNAANAVDIQYHGSLMSNSIFIHIYDSLQTLLSELSPNEIELCM